MIDDCGDGYRDVGGVQFGVGCWRFYAALDRQVDGRTGRAERVAHTTNTSDVWLFNQSDFVIQFDLIIEFDSFRTDLVIELDLIIEFDSFRFDLVIQLDSIRFDLIIEFDSIRFDFNYWIR